MNIYYAFEKTTGLFAGSGVTEFDDLAHGSTTTPVPDYDADAGEQARWDGVKWTISPR